MRLTGSFVKPFENLIMIIQVYGPCLLKPDIDNIFFGNKKPKNWDGNYLD